MRLEPNGRIRVVSEVFSGRFNAFHNLQGHVKRLSTILPGHGRWHAGFDGPDKSLDFRFQGVLLRDIQWILGNLYSSFRRNLLSQRRNLPLGTVHGMVAVRFKKPYLLHGFGRHPARCHVRHAPTGKGQAGIGQYRPYRKEQKHPRHRHLSPAIEQNAG